MELYIRRPPLSRLELRVTWFLQFTPSKARRLRGSIVQISQTAACNRLHKIEERLARWLLMMRDRVLSGELHLTQEFLSHMLGIWLAGVNEAVRTLTLNGLVRHRRNVITILDRAGLEAAACECCALVRDARGIFDT